MAAGAAIQATRNPGATVLEKLLRYTTRPSRSSALIGRVSAAVGDIVEVQRAVWIVLDDQHVAARGPFEERWRFSRLISRPVGF